MKEPLKQNVFKVIGRRAENHIFRRLLDVGDEKLEIKYPGWKEVELYNFVKSAVIGKIFVTSIGQDLHRTNFSIDDPTGKSYEQALNKSIKGLGYSVNDFQNAPLQTLLEFYLTNKDSAEPNDLFLNIEKDRAYGLNILNVHSADIDIKMGENAKNNHLMIRYNENTTAGWATRMQYITQIFQNMGFNTEINGRYIHMIHPEPGDQQTMKPTLTEAIRGLVSTTHLNLTFGYAPESLEDAVQAFKNGITNVHEHLEIQPYVAKKRQQYDWEHKTKFLYKEDSE